MLHKSKIAGEIVKDKSQIDSVSTARSFTYCIVIYIQGEPEKRIPYVINYIHQRHSLHTSSSINLWFMTS